RARTAARQRGLDEGQRPDPRRGVDAEVLCDGTAHRHPGEVGRAEAEGIEDSEGIGCQVDARVAGPAGWGRRRLSGIAVVESDDVQALGSQQHAEVLVPPVYGLGGTGDEEDRRSARVTELVDRQADAVEAE